jgi:uncharacterized protein (TIGR02145 family)
MKKSLSVELIIVSLSLLFLATGCNKNPSEVNMPSIATLAATNVLTRCATLNGTVTGNADGSSSVIFEYGTTTSYGSSTKNLFNYTSADALRNVYADITGLTAETTYHFRIKVSNINATVYGDDMSFSTPPVSDHTGETGTVEDAEGNVYKTIGIGSQIWMAENLKTTRYANGDPIGTTTPSTLDISGENTPKYQWAYNGDESNVAIYGRLYTWHAVTDSRNVCPTGWHVPTDSEWTILTDFLLDNCYGYSGNERTFIESSMAITSWPLGYCVCHTGNNSSGFSALQSGYREHLNGNFYHIGVDCWWWSSTETSSADAYYRSINNTSRTVNSHYDNKQLGFSVRCLKD